MLVVCEFGSYGKWLISYDYNLISKTTSQLLYFCNHMGIIKSIAIKFYLLRMKLNKIANVGKIITNTNNTKPITSIYEIKVQTIEGKEISLEQFRGKKLLIVNTASECGYTPQYAQLQEMTLEFKDKLNVLGIPSNDFGEQEPLDDSGVKQFCEVRYGVTFPLTKKYNVIGNTKTDLYQWLSNKNQNGWNNQQPEWNFYKYLIDESGTLVGIYSQHIEPFADEILKHIE